MSSTLRTFLIWLVPAIVVAVAVARVSVWIQPHFAPLGLFPLLIGAALGALLCGLIQIANLRSLRLSVVGAVIVVLLAAAAEHAFFYLDRRSEHLRKASEAGIPDDVLSTATFPEYLRRQAELDDMKVPLWFGNAVLMVGAAGGMVIWYVKSRHVGESLRDSSAAADVSGETRPRDADHKTS
jgi:4-amino-4-deoxy-L-arabinose transferase-like glycosyltransferase